MGHCKTKQTKNSNNNTTCGQEICSSKLGILGRIKTKNDPTDRRRPHTKPRFYSYVPFDDSVFLIRTTKKQQKKKFLFSVLFILKKREKNLKEKKILANYCISLDDYFFDHFNYKYAMTFFECI